MITAPPQPSRATWCAVLLVACVCAVLITRLGLHSTGRDWYISEWQAAMSYSALVHYHELPLFSWFVNGGEHQLQNPQGMVTSPALLFIVACGPEAGLRVAAGAYAALGVLAMWLWLRRYMCDSAALCAGAAWVLSLGFFWRIAVGNDMFIWHVWLPGVLWALDRLITRPGWRTALALALILGMIGYGPTFHSTMYLLAPGIVLWCGVQAGAVLLLGQARWRYVARVVAWGAVALAVAVWLCTPRIVMWLQIPIDRTIWFDSTIQWRVALRCLVDSRMVAEAWLPRVDRGPWGVWETSVALGWAGTLCAGLGLLRGLWRPSRLWCYALVVMVVGFVLAVHTPLYRWLFAACGARFRVPDRFLMLCSFGLAVLAGCGVNWLGNYVPRTWRAGLAALIVMGIAAQAWWWQEAAMRAETIKTDAMPWRAHPPLQQRAGLHSVAPLDGAYTALYRGYMLLTTLPTPGAEWNAAYSRKVKEQKLCDQPLCITQGHVRVTMSHRCIRVNEMAPGAEVRLRFMPSMFGERVHVTPPRAEATLLRGPFHMRLRNSGAISVQTATISARVPVWWKWRRGDDVSPNVRVEHDSGLLVNGAFDDGLAHWELWNAARTASDSVRVVPAWTSPGMRHALRVENPQRLLVGVQQRVVLKSNAIYRLGGTARSIATTRSDLLFGGRLAIWQPPQPEREIVWMSEYNDWWQKYLVFTNQMNGTAVVYVHLGYGNVATTGEFTNITLEELSPPAGPSGQ